MATVKMENDLCRCCHAEGRNYHSLHKPVKIAGQKEVYSEMLRSSLAIELWTLPGDNSTSTFGICEECVLRLRDAFSFKQQVLLCEQRFRQLYSHFSVAFPESFAAPEVKLFEAEPDEAVEAKSSSVEVSVKMESDSDEVGDTSKVKVELFHNNDDDDNDDRYDIKFDDSDDEPIVRVKETLDQAESAPETKPTNSKAKPKEKKEGAGKKGSSLQTTIKKKESFMMEGDLFVCAQCGMKLATVENMRGHLYNIHRFVCEICKKSCPSKPTLTKHKWSVHNIDERHQCTKCDEKFISERHLDIHFNSFHKSKKKKEKKESKKEKCGKAEPRFKREGDMFVCLKCGIKKAKEGTMNFHVRKQCLLCDICKKSCPSESQLSLHLLSEHKIDEKLQCDECDTKFNSKNALYWHIKIYHMLGEKFDCDQCGFTCYKAEYLKKHTKVHVDIRKYACKFCRKTFKRKDTLQTHERIHTGEKTKKCQVCGDAFLRKASLNYHMAKRHPEVPL